MKNKKRLTLDDARVVWSNEFLADFLKLPKGRKGNCPEKKAFLTRLFQYEKDGKVFSNNMIARLMSMDTTTILHHRKNLK